MPSKTFKERQKRKERYHANPAAAKADALKQYENNREVKLKQAKLTWSTDKQFRKRHTSASHRSIENNCAYKEKHRSTSLENKRRKLAEDPDYLAKRRQTALRYTRRRLVEDPSYCAKNRQTARQNTSRRLVENPDYCAKNRQRALQNTSRRLVEDPDYCAKNRERAIQNTRRRWREDDEYRKRHRKIALDITRRRLDEDCNYREMNRQRSRMNKQCKYTNDNEQRHQQNSTCHRNCHTNGERNKPVTSNTYWIRRTRLIADCKRKVTQFHAKKKMAEKSKVSHLHVDLLFHKARRTITLGLCKLKRLHNHLATKSGTCLDQLPTDRQPTDDELTSAFGGIKAHTQSSEPYFWEQAYHLLSGTGSIAVDTAGRAHIFQEVVSRQQDLAPSLYHLDNNDMHNVTRWQCNTNVCEISPAMVDGTVKLLKLLHSTPSSNCCNMYNRLDHCQAEARADRLGHPVYCHLDHQHCTSLLLPVRILSTHYPFLRTLTARIYEQRRVAFCIGKVRQAMNNSQYQDLQTAVTDLKNLLDIKHLPAKSTTDNDEKGPIREEEVICKFQKSLAEVADMRDRYTTTSCDVCEQLQDDVKKLVTYEGKKGFTSDKMTAMIDLLYQRKTQVEDFNEFLESVWICGYCADKLRGNKDIARCAFNKLAVEETPECLQQLNIFETALIKHCITSVTIVRLGQVTNVSRPNNELTAAMKGRIAYLPVDVAANASFVPDNILNLDSFILLVGGQPTKQKKVWTSLVDLRKVHKALEWLRQNNKFYKDIPAYTLTDMEAMINKQLTTTSDDSTDKALIHKLNEAAKSHLYENFTVQPLTGEFPADTLIDYQLNKIQDNPEHIFATDLDVKAYPELFPTGENGMRDISRAVKISTTDFLKSRLLNKNPKFRLNINYLFHTFQVQEISNMCHSIGHMLRTVSGTQLTAQSLLDRLKSRDGEVNSKLFAMMANMRGTTEYFSKLSMDIKWMIRHLGPPTLFITVSIAEWYSEPLLDYLRTVNQNRYNNINNMTAAELCAADPVSVNIHFHKKWHAIFSRLIKSKSTPIFGEVLDHFWRIEYQARGAPHVHCLLWIKDAPLLGRDSPEDVKNYIDGIITASKPDKDSSPTLHELVTRFQSHKCNKYCLKSYKRNGQFYKKCRFGFPRPVRSVTQLNNVIDCLAVNQSKQPRKRLYNIHRREDEVRINDYNAALLLASQSNVDVQYISHTGSRLPYYITSYITKHERSEQDRMWEDIYSASRSLGSNAMSFALKAVKSRPVGANEAADRLLGNKLYSKSRQMRFADLNPPQQAKRVLKRVTELEKIVKTNPSSQEIFFPHWVIDVYPDRPASLENMSLHDFLSHYDRVPTRNDHSQLQLNTLGFHLRKRTHNTYIVTHRLINPNKSPEDEELHYYQLLKLFKPWRNEADLITSGQTYKETFSSDSNTYPDMTAYHNQLVHQQRKDEDLNDAIRTKQQEMQELQAVDDQQAVFEGCATNTAEAAMQDVVDAHKNMTGGSTSTAELYNSLNTDQRRVVDRVLTEVCDDTHPCRLIVSGEGGTGKSRVIHVLQQMVTEKHPSNMLPVAVTAPTGIAAYNVGGTTIHRLLSLPVEHGKPADYARLHQEQLTMIRGTLKNLKLLIIDELSMVSSLTLLYIHLRLTEIMSNNEPFGGISIVCFADFLQLPPVKGNQPFEPVTLREAKQRLGSVSSLPLWQVFEYDELTINVRQHGDKVYANLLSNIRLGHIDDEEYKLLNTRRISTNHPASTEDIIRTYYDLTAKQLSPVILLPRTDQCDKINTALLAQLDSEIVDLMAADTLDTVVDKNLLPKVNKAYKKVDEDITRTAGLDKCLRVCIGARVMLKRNINVEAGLVNGAIGLVTGFQKSKTECGIQISSVNVKFENITDSVKIERQSSTFEVLKSIYFTRKQFPLILAFAITIHKSQGLSLNTAIVDVGQTSFGSGMTYVALSRITSLNGLHLIDIARQKITANRSALSEYNRLRMLYTPHLGRLPLSNKYQDDLPMDDMLLHTDTNQTLVNDDDRLTAGISQCSSQQTKCPRKRPHTDQISPKCSTATETLKKIKLQSSSPTANIYNHCEVASLDTEFQLTMCENMNLQHSNSAMPNHNSSISIKLQQIIYRQTNNRVSVHTYQTIGDGNCLFRALSLAITQNQDNHQIIRSYVVNHMLDEAISVDMANLFAAHNNQQQSFQNHREAMQKLGTWGTEQEIVSAAHLFNCSILCCSQYNSTGDVCIQHFPPHFASNPTCSNSCCHKSLYLINTSSHYEAATVLYKPSAVSQHHLVDVEP